jgi:hypothetical protein
VRVDGLQGLHTFLAAVFKLDSDSVDHIEVLVRGAVRAFSVERVKNQFGYPLRKESA